MVLVQKQPEKREGMNVEHCPLQSHPCILRKLMMQTREGWGKVRGKGNRSCLEAGHLEPKLPHQTISNCF